MAVWHSGKELPPERGYYLVILEYREQPSIEHFSPHHFKPFHQENDLGPIWSGGVVLCWRELPKPPHGFRFVKGKWKRETKRRVASNRTTQAQKQT